MAHIYRYLATDALRNLTIARRALKVADIALGWAERAYAAARSLAGGQVAA